MPLKQFPVCSVEREDVNRAWQSQRVEETDSHSGSQGSQNLWKSIPERRELHTVIAL